MKLDLDLLRRFEAGLDPQRIEMSNVPARLIGYGEISAIFQIHDNSDVAYKRMPLFHSVEAAASYAELYAAYCALLNQAGLQLPDTGTAVVAITGRPVVLYIAQKAFSPDRICNNLIRACTPEQTQALVNRILSQQQKIWDWNQTAMKDSEIAVDGQISNWALEGDIDTGVLYYIDTSTPFIKKHGRHQLDPELLLQAAPAFLRWLVRWLFVDEVMDRYYDPRKNMIDLAANLYKEQRPDLIPAVIAAVNDALPRDIQPITPEDVARYYKEDKFIWSLFLTLRRLDRFLSTAIFRRRYEFILPGKIQR